MWHFEISLTKFNEPTGDNNNFLLKSVAKISWKTFNTLGTLREWQKLAIKVNHIFKQNEE